ncbi:hypothetical protein VSAK1_14942 [Vibrio mediterranei AK1]|nr:hypothetical protein VSAK1_14942 [Vibrio mediterranei AK1]
MAKLGVLILVKISIENMNKAGSANRKNANVVTSRLSDKNLVNNPVTDKLSVDDNI